MASKKITVTINDNKITCEEGDTIIKVARENEIFIPGLCGHPDFKPKGNCRVCLVEVEGRKGLATSCSLKAENGMMIKTDTERVKKARNLNLELIFAEHIEKCPTCVWRHNCILLKTADKYHIEIRRFKDRKSKRKTYKFANAVEIDGTQCIDCRNCIDACSQLQKIDYLEIKGKGIHQEIVPVDDPEIDCIYCGQCALHCPVSAAQEQSDWQELGPMLRSKNKIIVAQFAPAVRVSIGEEFGLPYGKVATGQLVSALRELGFNYVFDVNFAADLTTMVEAKELIDRIKRNLESGNRNQAKNYGTNPHVKFLIPDSKFPISGLPMFTSCCPAWVKYAEFYHPELLPNLTTARSPHIMNGGVIKTYWAKKLKKRAEDIIVVSIMPCTAKKFEAARRELNIGLHKPVDYVLTVRELGFMLKNANIDLASLTKSDCDEPLGQSTGAAAIYGGSGGVMESALRTAEFMLCQKNKACKEKLEFKEFHGLDGIKAAEIEINKLRLKIAVVNGIGNFPHIYDRLGEFHYIEVMACPGGCIGGGGQPIPTTPEIRRKRIEALYKLDKSSKIRKAHENKPMLEVLEWLEKNHTTGHRVLHTRYKRRK